MAIILGNLADCRHVRMFCSDPRYTAICTQHHVYNKFVTNNEWRLIPNQFTVQDFNRECAYYSNFLQHSSITPELYDRRMSYVTYLESFVTAWYDQTLNQTLNLELEEDENIVGMQQDLFCNAIINQIDDAIAEFIEPPYELPGVHILGTPQDDDLEYNTYADETGQNLEEDMREISEGHDIYIMISSDREEDNENKNNFIVHYITDDSIRPLFTTGV